MKCLGLSTKDWGGAGGETEGHMEGSQGLLPRPGPALVTLQITLPVYKFMSRFLINHPELFTPV